MRREGWLFGRYKVHVFNIALKGKEIGAVAVLTVNLGSEVRDLTIKF